MATSATPKSAYSQKQDTQLASIIDHLHNGDLPDDPQIARRLLLTKDNFVIRDDKLLHIGVTRQKNITDQQRRRSHRIIGET